MRLLLAEDELDLSRALVRILKANHYEVDAVYDGRDALDYLETGVYDGAILDVMMPKMDGFTVLRKIRSAQNDIPVLMLTARSEIDDRVQGLDSGADDYLTKPFSTRELIARVRSITRRRTVATDASMHLGRLTLDQLTCTANAPGGNLHLANKEYQILEMLLANPGQIISPDQFMEKIWGFESDVEQNVVWVNISNLRRKLKSIDAGIVIKASRGLGYFVQEEE